jgi:hypothetical protein
MNEPFPHHLSLGQRVYWIEIIRLTRVYRGQRISNKIGRSFQFNKLVRQRIPFNTVLLYPRHCQTHGRDGYSIKWFNAPRHQERPSKAQSAHSWCISGNARLNAEPQSKG